MDLEEEKDLGICLACLLSQQAIVYLQHRGHGRYTRWRNCFLDMDLGELGICLACLSLILASYSLPSTIVPWSW